MSDERWLPVVGYEGLYEVSDCGQLRSLPRASYGGGDGGKGLRLLQGRIISPALQSRGYLSAVLSNANSRRTALIHRLVAAAFVPNPERFPVVNHIDCDQTNNHFSNLEWCTQMANVHHAIALGRNPWAIKGASSV